MTLPLSDKICNLLIEKKLITKDDLKKAKETSKQKGESLGSVLVKMHSVSKDDLLSAASEDLGCPPLRLSNYKIDEDILAIIPKRITTQYQLLPISRIEKQLTVAMVDPMNVVAIDDIKAMTKLEISPVITTEEDMKEAQKKCYEKAADEEISSIVEDIKSAQMEMVAEEEGDEISSGELIRITEEAPVVKLTNMILSKAVKEHASDVLIEPMEGNSRVRYRIDGVLYERYSPPKKFHAGLISRLKVMSDLDIAERRLPQDGRFRLKIEGRKIDFRLSTVASSFGERAVLRILDKGQANIDLDRLGFGEKDKKKIRTSSEKPHGLILVCGPTGSGKTTTLYSILSHVDSPGMNLVTVEDPVEFEIKGFNQVSVNEEIGLTFAGCLRSILRQDPDVIMIGEIRDFETIDIAIKSALTGHLVVSTLHTNTAAGSVVRMINMGVEPFLIASSVELIMAQRLIRRLCQDCRKAYEPSKEIAKKYNLFDEKGKIKRIYEPAGCKKCNDSGYRGRIGIAECMEMSPAVKDLIFKQAQDFEIERVAIKEGMTTLRQNGMENVLAGETSLEEVLRVTVETRETE